MPVVLHIVMRMYMQNQMGTYLSYYRADKPVLIPAVGTPNHQMFPNIQEPFDRECPSRPRPMCTYWHDLVRRSQSP